MLAPDPLSFPETFTFSGSTLPSCSHDLHLFFTQSPPALFSLCSTGLPLWVMLSLYLCDFICILQDFLSKPLSFFLSVLLLFLSGCNFLSRAFLLLLGRALLTSGNLSLHSLLLPPLISHNSPPRYSSVDFRQRNLYWCVFCLLL